MGILVANGCSFTYGDEMKGSRNPEGFHCDTHHHATYVAKLAELMGVPYKNLAMNGSSNEKIFRRTMHFIQTTKKDIDLLVVQWSSLGRFEIVEEQDWEHDVWVQKECNANQVHLGIKMGSVETGPRFVWEIGNKNPRNLILKHFSEEVLTVSTMVLKTLSYMNIIQHVCDIMNIRVIQHHANGVANSIVLRSMRNQHTPEYSKQIASYIKGLPRTSRIGLGKYETLWDLSNRKYGIYPCGHPKEEAHEDFAKLLYNVVIPDIPIKGKQGELEA